MAHYEQFRHYHETFYARVEPLSVTPLSITSLERGLDGVLVSAARVLQAAKLDGLSPERNAGKINSELGQVGTAQLFARGAQQQFWEVFSDGLGDFPCESPGRGFPPGLTHPLFLCPLSGKYQADRQTSHDPTFHMNEPWRAGIRTHH